VLEHRHDFVQMRALFATGGSTRCTSTEHSRRQLERAVMFYGGRAVRLSSGWNAVRVGRYAATKGPMQAVG
jgi:hypothetical protein